MQGHGGTVDAAANMIVDGPVGHLNDLPTALVKEFTRFGVFEKHDSLIA